MALHEDTIREQYTTLLTAFRAAFPGVTPPIGSWWQLWLDKYSFGDIADAIQHLGKHPMKARFTQESTGKALSAILRQTAMTRAIADAPTPGGVR